MRTIRPILTFAAALTLAACGSSKPSSTAGGSTAEGATTASTTTSTPVAPAPTTSTPGVGGPSTVSVTKGTVSASMHSASHHPVVERPWPISFIVTSSGKAASASVDYEYLFAGQVVAHRSHYTFHGHFSDIFKWPAEAVGYPLTFRAVIRVGGMEIDLDYPVQVVK